LMEQFYRHQLNQAQGAAAALRHAQGWLRRVTRKSVCRRLTAELTKLPASDKGSAQEEILRSALLAFSDTGPDSPFEDPSCGLPSR